MKLKYTLITIVIAYMISCTSYSRQNDGWAISDKSDIYKILYFGSLAASSHNTQPWKVVYRMDTIEVFPDFARKLNVVDPYSRELYISLGAFVENIDIAANHFGYITDVKIGTSDSSVMDSSYVVISLQKAKKTNIDINELELRRTIRSPFDTIQISPSVIEYFISENRTDINFVSAKSDKGEYIKQKTVEAYTQQAKNPNAQDELTKWIRFSNNIAKVNRDGLTTSGMEIKGLAGFLVRNFFKPDDSKNETFVSKGIEKTRIQAEHCGGWIIITQNENTPISWINTGRIIQRINLKCLKFMVGFHPMTQMIEEVNFEKQANNLLDFNGTIQFVARIGYVKEYPIPESLRRPVESFTKFE